MIRYVDRLQALHCSVCGKWIELDRSVIRDPDKLVDKIDREKELHKDCKAKDRRSKIALGGNGLGRSTAREDPCDCQRDS